MSQAGGKAVVVCYDNGRIQGLEIQDKNSIAVEAGFWLHYQGNTLWGFHLSSLLDTGSHSNVVHGLCNAQHHRLHAVLHNSLDITITIKSAEQTCIN